MKVSYNGLWKLLIEYNMKKMDLVEELGISTSTLAKMSRGEPVSMQEYVKNSTVILVIWFLIIQHQRSENR